MFGGTAAAQAPTTDDLQRQISELEKQVATLQSKQRHQSQQNADATAIVDRMLEDSQRRSQFLAATGLLAGYDQGFFIKSDDDAFLVRPGLQTQFRYVGSYVNGTGGTDDNTESGFEIRRMRLRFDGNVFTKDLTYSFVWDVSRTDGVTSLLDSWVAYHFAPQWNLKIGQFKESVFHEKDVPFTNQLAVERSLVDAVLGGNNTDRVQGVSLIYGGGTDDDVRAEVAATDGANSNNASFQDTPAGNFGFAGRFEYKVSGNWS
ncbi:MAG: hypothetical protein H7Z14_14395, partial [Anaerolineae bacterium]|nr:hypothetical protein [Phycisphaerae bacterium]